MNLLAASVVFFGSVVTAEALDAPWQWTVSAIPGQTFDSREAAEIAMRGLGGHYALATVVERQTMTETSVTYTYGARNRPRYIGPWMYKIWQGGPQLTEEAAIADVAAYVCELISLVRESDWAPTINDNVSRQQANYRLRYRGGVRPNCGGEYNYIVNGWREREISCPTHLTFNAVDQACARHGIATITGPIQGPPTVCEADTVGCSVSTGNNSLEQVDVDLPWITFSRHYQSQITVPHGGFGNHWTHSLNVHTTMSSWSIERTGVVTETGHQVPINGTELVDGSGGRIVSVSTAEWRWVRSDGSYRTFNVQGRMTREDLSDGTWYTFAYDSQQRLTTATHSSGRALTFVYVADDPAGSDSRIEHIKFGTQVLVSYAYDGIGNLIEAEYADGTSIQYHYEDTAFPSHLTGVTDENGDRFATYAYDEYGRATLSEHAGGAKRVELAYQTNGTTVVTDALGKMSTYAFTNDGRYRKPVSLQFDGHTQSWIYPTPATDFKRRPTQTVDRNGNTTNYSYVDFHYDSARATYMTRTRRIKSAGTPVARTIDTYRLRYGAALLATEVQGNRTTSYFYNSRNQLTTRTEKDTASGTERTTAFTYCEAVTAGCPWIGLLKSVDGPRTDVADITSYEYDAQGNLSKVINALGHETTYDLYNDHGQPLSITDQNGVVTTLTYDLRHRLTSRTVGLEQTSFEYWSTGLLKKATLPDGSFLEYTYDSAHRLTGINDDEGNRIHYTLNAMGNRTSEEVFDPSNALRGTRTQVFNTLNQLWKQIGAAGGANVTTTFGYDDNGNQTSIAAPLARNASQTYDALNRLKTVTDAESGVTTYGYNVLDQLISVTDPKGLTTSYTYNALGDLQQQVSPDTGTTTNTYDSGGNLKTSTDARSKTATYDYDALNRVTSMTYADQVIGYTYDAGTNHKGRLTQLTDNSGSTSWSYDAQGRVLSRQQTIGAISKSVSYGYDASGRLQTLTLPSGNVITYGYANGKVASLTLNGATTLLSNVLYHPFGPTAGWTWGNSTLAVREYDQDGNITLADSAGLRTYAYDDAFRITGITDASDPNLSQGYSYDLLDRLTSASGTSLNQSWTYDANGNRLTQGGSQSSSYIVSTTSNRVNSIAGALTKSYGYDSAGNTTADGAATYTYNDAGRMISATKAGITTTYALNGLGQRVRKTTGGVSAYFAFDEAGHLIGEYDTAGDLIAETIWFGDISIAVLKPNGSGSVNVYYIHTDHLNTPRKITRPSDNAIVWRWDSDPFGTTLANENPSGLGVFSYQLRFPGQYYDPETELHYNYYRDYDPSTGRYIQSDPIGLSGGTNTYAYGLNNPPRFIDPLGLAPGDIFTTREAAEADRAVFATLLEERQFALDVILSKLVGADEWEGGRLSDVHPVTLVDEFSCSSSYTYDWIQFATGVAPVPGRGFITGYTRHGLNQAISREGRGVSVRSILDAVRSPTSVRASSGGTTVYRGADGTTVVLNQNGRVVTTYGRPRGP